MSGKNLKFCLVGSNIKSSLSPTIFNYWFRKYEIKASYVLEELSEYEFSKKICGIINGYEGFNVTSPFKKRIIEELGTISEEVKKTEAVNCVWNKKGFNTDIYGFKNAFLEKEIESYRKVIILGMGGAAKAVGKALEEINYKNVMVNRKEIGEIIKKKLLNIYTEDVIVNCTTKIGLLEGLVSHKYIDINYMGREKKRDSFALKMLVYQAQKNFQIWFGFSPEITNILYNKLTLS